jgi:hypothetical protein
MDTMIRLVVMALAVYGLANAIAVLKAGLPLRTFLETRELQAQNKWLKGFWTFWRVLFKCPPCLSFWFGMAGSYWVLSITKGLIAPWWLAMPVDGLIVCATSWLLHLWAERTGHGLDV